MGGGKAGFMKERKGVSAEDVAALFVQSHVRSWLAKKRLKLMRMRASKNAEGVYEDPAVDPKLTAEEYLTKHKIVTLFENLTSKMFYNLPDDPKAFILAELMALRKARDEGNEHTRLFNTEDIRTVFALLDVGDKGKITKHQAAVAIRHLDIPESVLAEAPPQIDEVQFMEYMSKGFSKANRIYHEKGNSVS